MARPGLLVGRAVRDAVRFENWCGDGRESPAMAFRIEKTQW